MIPKPVTAVVEIWTIPTYPIPKADEMPMFAELRGHQGTTGNPYPNRVIQTVDREHRADKEYEVVRLENDYIRVCMIPALGGRIFEAYDKKTDYDFLYRQHAIKPALIGAYGSWISGGVEFNWPFHHRPSSMMPVDFCLETEADGTAICWLSEHDPTDRTKGMVGIVLRPDASYFETRVKLSNRTPLEHPFLWWENAAVKIHPKYRLNFPPDVTWAHHHYDRSHTTFPIAKGQYGAELFEEPTDISWHGNTKSANSYFAAPSKFDFFGGYDYEKQCGVIHVANHHVSPGKKMFTWGYGRNADNWEAALTDTDGQYCELMAGSFTDDQPDFTWLAPYETKYFSQFWYPTQGIGYVTYANLDAAVSVEKEAGKLRLITTRVVENARFRAYDGEQIVLDEVVSLKPAECLSFDAQFSDAKYTVTLTAADGGELLRYTQITPDFVHIPKDNPGIPTPDQLTTAQELYIAGLHIDQYRDPTWKPDAYYLEALKYDPKHLSSLIAMGEYCYRTARFQEGLEYLNQAMAVQNRYDTNPKDGTAAYLTGLCLRALGKTEEAYDSFYKASWSYNAVSKAMTQLAAIDGCRGDYKNMKAHALQATEKEAQHPIAPCYAAIACWKLGDTSGALAILDSVLAQDRLNHLARFVRLAVAGEPGKGFYATLRSNLSQTCLDVAFDLANAGQFDLAILALDGLDAPSTMARYTLAALYETAGNADRAAVLRKSAAAAPIVEIFPYRLDEIPVLESAIRADAADGTAPYLLGCLLYDRRQYQKAAELWRRAVEAAPDFYIPYRNLAVACYSKLSRKQEALEWLKKAVALKPNDIQLLNEISFLMASVGVSGAERAAYIQENIPADASDDLVLELAKAYNDSGDYDRALDALMHHTFTPGEGGEFAIAETYMFGRFAAGRKALKQGDNEKALECFQSALQIPANLNASYWNESVTVPYRYYEAEALTYLGRTEEANAIISHISKLKNTGMWNMGGEFTYYTACIARLSGDTMRAQAIMREAILNWETQLGDTRHAVPAQRPGRFFCLCYTDDPLETKEANLCFMLGFGKLYNGDKAQARELFARSLALNPDNTKCRLELELL